MAQLESAKNQRHTLHVLEHVDHNPEIAGDDELIVKFQPHPHLQLLCSLKHPDSWSHTSYCSKNLCRAGARTCKQLGNSTCASSIYSKGHDLICFCFTGEVQSKVGMTALPPAPENSIPRIPYCFYIGRRC